VGMLTSHVTRQIVRTAELLSAPDEAKGDVLSAAEHYSRAAWVTATSLDDPSMDRSADEDGAKTGFVRCVTRGLTAYGTVHGLLGGDPSVAGSAAERVFVPWQGWALQRDQFLLTRMVEFVTHSADLAASVDLAMPDYPDDVIVPVTHLLTDLARRRHGQEALVSALTRAERTPASISAFGD
jgi:hypothetical protein